MQMPARLGWMLALVLLQACATQSEPPPLTPKPALGQLPGAVDAPRVYLEAALLRIPAQRLGELASRSYAELAAQADGTVLSAPRVLLAHDQRAHYQLVATEEEPTLEAWRWAFTTRVLRDRRVELSLELSRERSSQAAQLKLNLFDRQLALLPTQLAGGAEDLLVIVLRPHVIEHPTDMQRILESKARTAAVRRL